MRAVVFASKGRVRIQDVDQPRIREPADALVRVTLSGICGTDLHLVSGDFAGIEPGVVIGHEFVGEVREVGSAVRSIRAGDRVCGSDFTACGVCRWCARGEHWECDERRFFGSGRAFGPDAGGGQAEFIRVPFADVTLAVVPAGCSDEAAILVCDNLPTGWAAVDLGGLEPAESVAIIGGGPIGQLTALCAQTAGAAAVVVVVVVVVVVEPSEVRRRFATGHGSVAVTPDAAAALIAEVTAGDGADLVVEAVGQVATLDAAIALVRKRGRIVSVAAHAAPSLGVSGRASLRARAFSVLRDRRFDPLPQPALRHDRRRNSGPARGDRGAGVICRRAARLRAHGAWPNSQGRHRSAPLVGVAEGGRSRCPRKQCRLPDAARESLTFSVELPLPLTLR
jgi:alcohol dehydrogenase